MVMSFHVYVVLGENMEVPDLEEVLFDVLFDGKFCSLRQIKRSHFSFWARNILFPIEIVFYAFPGELTTKKSVPFR